MPLTCTDLRAATAARRPTVPVSARPAAARRRAGVLAGLAAGVALAACGGRDPFAPNPANNIDTQQADIRVYPLGAARGPLGSAVSLLTLTAERPSLVLVGASGIPAPNFDFAVDRAPDGRVRLLPSRTVVDLTGVGQPFSTAFQLSATPFDSLAEAPNAGYQADTLPITVGIGQSVVVRAQSGSCTAYYAKAVVVGIDAVTGEITVRARVNPNCGFRSLRPGRG
jgi:hypothetical protein